MFILVKDMGEGRQRFVTKISKDFRSVQSEAYSNLDLNDRRPALAKKWKTKEQAEQVNASINKEGGYDDYRVGTLDELPLVKSDRHYKGRWI